MSIGFSQSFPIELSIISRALRAHDENPKMTKKQIAAEVGLNKPKMDGISAWLRYFKLWQYRKGALPIAQILLQYDKYFSYVGTQWLLHYILVTDENAEVWNYCFNNYFEAGKSFERDDLQDTLLGAGIGENTKYLSTDTGILLNSYTVHDDAFNSLDILEILDSQYTIKSPSNIPSLIVAFALYRWREEMGNITTTSIDKLLNDDNQVGKIFLLTKTQLENILAVLETMGIVRVSKTADLDNITYTYEGTSIDLLERYYREN